MEICEEIKRPLCSYVITAAAIVRAVVVRVACVRLSGITDRFVCGNVYVYQAAVGGEGTFCSVNCWALRSIMFTVSCQSLRSVLCHMVIVIKRSVRSHMSDSVERCVRV